MHHISQNWECISDFQYKVAIGTASQYEIEVKIAHAVFEWPHCSATEEFRFVVRRAKKVPDL